MIGGPFAVLLFLAIWSLLPGGAAELTALVSDVRSALRKRRDQPAADHPVPVTTGA
jgi:hypothetical protein